MLRNAVAVKHCVRRISTTLSTSQNFNEPLSGHQMPRAGGIASMMRLPVQENCDGLHACFVGVPLDIGTSNRSGTRFGPRQIRAESSLLRKVNIATDMAKIKVILSKMALRPINSQGHLRTRKARKKEEPGASPFDSFQVADIGDVSLNLYNLTKACEDIRNHFLNIVKTGCIPLALGGDHTMTYPILQAIKEKHGPVGLVHIDAHADINDTMLGEKIAHGTSFRRAMEDGCLDGHRVIQIGLRGSGYTMSDFDWAKQQGFRQVLGNECWNKSLTPLMAEVREMMGDRPVYISFDIDGLDPAFAPGTGTPEIAGLTPAQGLEIIRGCRGLNIVGCDLVEVSPPYDMAGTTALTGANLLFEMLCVLPEVKYLT